MRQTLVFVAIFFYSLSLRASIKDSRQVIDAIVSAGGVHRFVPTTKIGRQLGIDYRQPKEWGALREAINELVRSGILEYRRETWKPPSSPMHYIKYKLVPPRNRRTPADVSRRISD